MTAGPARWRGGPCAVYRMRNAAGDCLYVGCSTSPWARLAQLRQQADWPTQVVNIDVAWFPDRATALVAETKAIRAESPPHNTQYGPKPRKKRDLMDGHLYVAAWMEREGLTEAEAAERLDLDPKIMRRLLSGDYKPRAATEDRICLRSCGFVPENAWSYERKRMGYRPVTPREAKMQLAFVNAVAECRAGKRDWDTIDFLRRSVRAQA